MAASQFLDFHGLTHYDTKTKAAIASKADKTELPEVVSTEKDGLVKQLPNDETKFFNGKGEWSSAIGGMAGPVWLEVDDNGYLYAYYDDSFSEPDFLDYDEQTGNLYAIFNIEGV